MTKNEFKQGDRVRLKGDLSFTGTIKQIGASAASVVWDSAPNEVYLQGYENLEHLDRRTAFLTRLQSLLREFDATIEIVPYYQDNVALLLNIDCKTAIRYKNVKYLTADNIMNFDKE